MEQQDPKYRCKGTSPSVCCTALETTKSLCCEADDAAWAGPSIGCVVGGILFSVAGFFCCKRCCFSYLRTDTSTRVMPIDASFDDEPSMSSVYPWPEPEDDLHSTSSWFQFTKDVAAMKDMIVVPVYQGRADNNPESMNPPPRPVHVVN